MLLGGRSDHGDEDRPGAPGLPERQRTVFGRKPYGAAARYDLHAEGSRLIEVEGLRKAYGELVAVDGVSFTAAPGQILGLLGPNGAGKSTTIGCISGLLTPSAGRARVLGHDVALEPRAAKAALGVVPQELALYDEVSAEENLRFWGEACGLAGAALRGKVGEVLELVGLADRARVSVKKFSGGMKRRLNFACGVVHAPKVLLLDEPTVGVDPQSRVRLLDLVREQARGGACVLYTTHYMEEAQALCDRIGIIDHGRLIAMGTLAELRALIGERDLVRVAGRFDPARAAAALARVEGLEVVQAGEEALTLALPEASRRLPALFAALEAAGAEVRETTMTQPSLESLFIKLTGKELRE
jgi:ABC-2 type transport system ATP-binding protein